MSEIKYYLINDRLLGKEECEEYFLYRDGKWVPDDRNVILDRLMGFDSDEPPESPYGFGCESIMDEIEVISKEEAVKFAGGRV